MKLFTILFILRVINEHSDEVTVQANMIKLSSAADALIITWRHSPCASNG